METRASKRLKKLHQNRSNEVSAAGDGDRISNLPSDIVHHVFSFLPLKDVARTCVLSRRWNHLWYAYPCLDLTPLCSSDFFSGRDSAEQKRPGPFGRHDNINHVVRLLENHSDVKILKFWSRVRAYSALERLMKEAVAKNIQVLDIVLSARSRKPFNLPSCIVNSLTLRDLRLRSRTDCPGTTLPPLEVMKNGFKSLASLSLSNVSLSDHPSARNLFTDSSFPSLAKLRLGFCRGFKCLRVQISGLRDFSLSNGFELLELDISAEKLKTLSVLGCSFSTVKIDAPRLETIVWKHTDITEDCVFCNFDSLNEAVVGLCCRNYCSDSQMQRVSNLLTRISQCQYLTLDGRLSIEILSRLSHLGVGLRVFEKLKYLQLSTDLRRRHIPGLASLFRSSPAVHEVVIISISKDDLERFQPRHENDPLESASLGDEAYWDLQAQSLGSFLGHLKYVEIVGFKDSTNEVNLVKFLLKHGKGLQELTLSQHETFPIVREAIVESQIMGFPRASSDVQIVFD